MSNFSRKCKQCGNAFTSPYQLYKHMREVHAWVSPNKLKPQPAISPFDRLLEMKTQCKDIMAELEAERARLQERIILIDNTLVQYRKGCLPV